MKLLLTGAAGYVGSACLRWMLKRGHDVIAYDNLSEGNANSVPDGRLVVGDVADRELLVHTLKEHRIEGVMHFAAVASVPESIGSPELYWRTNLIGTKNLLDAMSDSGVMKIIFSSTAATYAFDVPMPIEETAKQQPTVPYGTTKLAAEWMIREYHRAYGIGFTIFRYFNASGADPDGQYGECRRHESHLIPLVLQSASGIRAKVLVYGADWPTRDGTCVRDYVHTDDLAQAHQLAMDTISPGTGRVYNIGSQQGTTVREVIKACETVVGKSIPVEFAERRPGDPAVLVARSDRLRSDLGWKPRFNTIEEIVETAWRWQQNHPNGYASGGVE